MFRQVIVFVFFLTCVVSAFGQAGAVIDSLRKQSQVLSSPEDKANVYNQLAWEFRDTRPDSALYYTSQALKIAEEYGYSRPQIQAYNYMGVAYRNLSVFSKAFEMYLEALRLSELYDDLEQRGYTLINLGNLYLYQTNFQGAINYFIQALDQAQSLGDRRMQAYCFINLGRSYEGKLELGQAELYYKQAIEVRKEENDPYGLTAAEIELAEIYRKQNKLDQAKKLINEIIAKTDIDKNPRALILIYNTFAKILVKENQTDLAVQFAIKSINIAKKVSSRYDEKVSLENLSEIYASREDYKIAYESHINYSELNQQLFSEETIRKIEQLKNNYEIEQQEAENEFLRQQAELNELVIARQQIIIILTSVVTILLIIFGVFSYRAYLIRVRLLEEINKQKDKIEADRNTIKHQSTKLIELDKAKSRFFANVSHDLRSPLSLILGNLEMIKEDDHSVLSPTAIKSLEVSFKNSKRLLYLTDEINDITRLEEGRITLRKELVVINTYVQMLLDMFVASAEYKGVQMQFESQLQPSEAFDIDSRQFEKIFYNLISNAMRHTHKGDRIIVEAIRDKKELILKFIDTGEGISKESLPYIFDRFYQSGEQSYKAQEGMGIGLALVSDLVHLHDGHITVESEIKIGTTFTIRLPISVSHENVISSTVPSSFIEEKQSIQKDLEAGSSVPVNVTDIEGSVPKILLVDDHPEIRYYIRQILEEQYLVLEASHGIEATAILNMEDVDLIITDLMMPWMDGFELIESINANENWKKIPLLVVSARISGEDKEKVLYQGINDYLQKPFSKKELILRIDNLIKQKEKYADETKNVFDALVKDNLMSIEHNLKLKLEQVVKERINDPNLSVLSLSDAMAASERQVYRLVKKLTGLTPLEYITEVRVQFADYLIRQNKVKNASEAAKSVGIRNVTTFNKLYEKRFGQKPSELFVD